MLNDDFGRYIEFGRELCGSNKSMYHAGIVADQFFETDRFYVWLNAPGRPDFSLTPEIKARLDALSGPNGPTLRAMLRAQGKIK